MPLDPYELSEATRAIVAQHFYSAVWGAPLLMWIVSLLFAWVIFSASSWRRSYLLFPILYAVLGVYWTSDAGHWKTSLDYRRFPIVILPVLGLLTSSRRRLDERPRGPDDFGEGLTAFSCAFGVVLVSQSFAWNMLRTVLQDQLRSFSGIHRQTEQPFQWMHDTALGNWTLPHQCLLLEPGRLQSLIFVENDPGSASQFVFSHHLTMDIQKEPVRGIWDFAAFREYGMEASAATGAGFFELETYAGREFRWAGRVAEIIVEKGTSSAGIMRLRLFSAFGPQQMTLEILDNGRSISSQRLDVGPSHFGAPNDLAVVLPAAGKEYRVRLTGDDGGRQFPNDNRTISWGLELPLVINDH